MYILKAAREVYDKTHSLTFNYDDNVLLVDEVVVDHTQIMIRAAELEAEAIALEGNK